MNPPNDLEAQEKPPRGVYLLPNLLTTTALFSGFFAILASFEGRFEHAAIAIFVAMVFDGLDGRVARITHTQTQFGAEYDSLSDMLAFGIAPSLVVYQWGLYDLGKFGWLAAFVYTAAAALRLARFNSQLETQDHHYFNGLPSPAAAAMLAGLIWFCVDWGLSPGQLSWFFALLTVSLGLLMVSNVSYYSFKEFDLRNRVPFMMVAAVVVALAVVLAQPATVLTLAFVVYAASGPLHWLKKRFIHRHN